RSEVYNNRVVYQLLKWMHKYPMEKQYEHQARQLLHVEHIVKIGGSSATRQELFCLSKDHIITAKIMELWARKCTWEQRSITLKTTWCLPPSFSAVVLSQIISSAHFEACPFEHGDFSGGWSSQTIEVVHDVQPPPTCQEDSALWISENQVLITTTIDLVLGSSNELRKTIMDNA
ncbi:hypothetical protein S83_005310, partial [Arachis hypogaea]